MQAYAASRLACVLARALVTAILLCFAQAAPASAQGDVANPLLPVDTSSPRATFSSFRTELEKLHARPRRARRAAVRPPKQS